MFGSDVMVVFRCLVLSFGLLSAAPALAQTGADHPEIAQGFADELRARGYSDVDVSWTWLGRLRVVGWIGGQEREIILHPTSGEVLRDVLLRVRPATVLADRRGDGADYNDGPPLAIGSALEADPGAPLAQDLLDPAVAPDTAPDTAPDAAPDAVAAP